MIRGRNGGPCRKNGSQSWLFEHRTRETEEKLFTNFLQLFLTETGATQQISTIPKPLQCLGIMETKLSGDLITSITPYALLLHRQMLTRHPSSASQKVRADTLTEVPERDANPVVQLIVGHERSRCSLGNSVDG